MAICLIAALIAAVAPQDTFRLNPAQKATLPYRFSVLEWELRNLPDKWRNRIAGWLAGGGRSQAERRDDLLAYISLGKELNAATHALQSALSDPSGNGIAAAQADASGKAREREALRPGVEETLESAISDALREAGLGSWLSTVLPPVDIRLTSPPILLLTSPRHHIERRHEALMLPGASLEARHEIEEALMSQGDVAAITLEIGGLATYPAFVHDTASLEDVFRVTAHEWAHHYLFFRPLGQRMLTSPEMTTLNETVADYVGREIGDRARSALFGNDDQPAAIGQLPVETQPDSPAAPLDTAPAAFDFNAEMRSTRIRVDALLGAGDVEDAEAYMEERRLMFLENGHPLRRLNQAYFAFHGSYAESAASSSPIAAQLAEFRALTRDLKTFVAEMGDIGDHDQFLIRLRALRVECGTMDGAAETEPNEAACIDKTSRK